MSRRIITPYSGFPDRDVLTTLESDYRSTRNVTSGVSRQKLQAKSTQHGSTVLCYSRPIDLRI